MRMVLDSQPQGPTQARGLGPSWSGAWLRNGAKWKRKKQNPPLRWTPSLRLAGKVEALVIPRGQPSLATSLALPKVGWGTDRLGSGRVPGPWPKIQPPESQSSSCSPSPPSSLSSRVCSGCSCSGPPGDTTVPGSPRFIQPLPLALPVPETCPQNRVMTEQKGCTYPLHLAS